MIDSYEVNELRDLTALRDDWNRLLAQTPGYSFFQTLEWLEATWHSYARAQRLRVIVVTRDGKPMGIVPWCVREERRRVGKVRVLTYPLDDWGTFYGPLGAEPRLAVRAAASRLAASPRDWDLIDLRWVDEAADEFLTIGESLRENGYDCRIWPRMEVRLCRLEGGWDEYAKSRSRNWRRRMQHDVTALNKFGKVELMRYRPEPGNRGDDREHEAVYGVCERIAAKTWQADDPSQSTLCSPRVHDTLLRAHLSAARLGMLDANILLVGGTPAAFNYNYVAERRVYGLRCGYDPTLEVDGCGRVLLYLMLQDSCRRGDVEYNFGPGRQHYKERFATSLRHAYTFRHYARYSLRSQLLHLKEEVAAHIMSDEHFRESHLVD